MLCRWSTAASYLSSWLLENRHPDLPNELRSRELWRKGRRVSHLPLSWNVRCTWYTGYVVQMEARPAKIPRTLKERDSTRRLIVILENASLEAVKVITEAPREVLQLWAQHFHTRFLVRKEIWIAELWWSQIYSKEAWTRFELSTARHHPPGHRFGVLLECHLRLDDII